MGHADEPAAPGIIFDLDGTLADSLRDIADAVNAALSDTGRPALSIARIREYVGDGAQTLMARAASTNDDALAVDLLTRFRSHYAAGGFRHTALYPGVGDALDNLHQAGCPMCVLSNKPDDFTRQICRRLLADWPFVSIDGVSESKPAKPDPTVACDQAERMRRPSEMVFLVGDSPSDIGTARAAGMRSVAVTWGLRDRSMLVDTRPDYLIDEPDQLCRLVLP